MIKINRVEKHIIKQNNKYYSLLDEFCYKSKNLYNYANYIIRQEFINNNKWLRYNELDKILKQEGKDFDYRNMPSSATSQQCLRLLDKNWKSFFASIKDYNKNPNKYLGRPKLPKYKSKNDRNILILTYVNCKINKGIIKFPKSFKGFYLKSKVNNLQQVRFIPKDKYIVAEVVYKIDDVKELIDNDRYIGIDLGLDNFVTITNNCELIPLVINGKGLKSINQYYNKQIAYYKSIAKKMNKLDYTNRMRELTFKRNNKVEDYIHKASRFVVDYCRNNEINTIIIGNNKNWKQNSKMSKKVNQNFISIPYYSFIQKVQYKAEEFGIQVIITEESYTSGTSFLDNELPIKENYNKNRRRHRGLFVSNKGIKINADVNGSYQIIKKVFPKAFADGIEGVGLHPFKVDLL
nr:MAG TPA_asm: endonuclease [Caudoviricetes sp.]